MITYLSTTCTTQLGGSTLTYTAPAAEDRARTLVFLLSLEISMLPCHLQSYISASGSLLEGPFDFDVSFVFHMILSCTTPINHSNWVWNGVEFYKPTYPKCKTTYYAPLGVLSDSVAVPADHTRKTFDWVQMWPEGCIQ